MAHSSFIAPALSRVGFGAAGRVGARQISKECGGNPTLVSDCLQLAVIPHQLSLHGSFSCQTLGLAALSS